MVERIKSLCKSKGITVKDLEIAIGLGNGTIGHWRKSKPKYDSLILVASYFGISVEELLSGEKTPVPPTENGLNSEQQALMDLYDALAPADRAVLIATARALAEARKSQGNQL